MLIALKVQDENTIQDIVVDDYVFSGLIREIEPYPLQQHSQHLLNFLRQTSPFPYWVIRTYNLYLCFPRMNLIHVVQQLFPLCDSAPIAYSMSIELSCFTMQLAVISVGLGYLRKLLLCILVQFDGFWR